VKKDGGTQLIVSKKGANSREAFAKIFTADPPIPKKANVDRMERSDSTTVTMDVISLRSIALTSLA
jgi:hypothetical protein